MSALLVELNRLPRARAYRRNAGHLDNGDGRRVKVGVAGQCDVWLLAWPGIHVEVECKIGAAPLTELQERWRRVVTEELGALHVIARASAQQTATDAAAAWAVVVEQAISAERDRRGSTP